MAVQTWTLRQINAGGTNPNRLWWDSSSEAAVVTQVNSVTGWNVGTLAADNYGTLNNGIELVRTSFSTTIVPNATAPVVNSIYPTTATFTPPTLLNSTGSISTLYTYNGYFPAGTWSFTFPMRAVTLGGTQDGAITMRVFKAARTINSFSPITELTTVMLQGTTVTNLSTTVTQNSVVSWTAPIVRLNNEFLICKLGWRIIGAGGGNNADAAIRYGAGATMTSPAFQAREYNIS